MKAYRNTADLFLIVAAVVILAGALAYFTGSAEARGMYTIPAITPICEVIMTPHQDGLYPPEGYHCRPLGNEGGDTGKNTPAVETPAVVPVVTETPVIVIDNGGETLPTETPSVPEQPETCTNANPGNKKCVGNAGEDPNGRGTMDNDSADGNGEHGNQGEGGSKDK